MARRCRSGALLVLLLGLGTLARWGAGPRGGGFGAASPTVGAEELEVPAATELGRVAAAAPAWTPAERTPSFPDRALVAAVAARNAGDRVEEEVMLVAALAGGDLAQVARVELAELVLESAPRRAASELLPVVVSPLSRELQGGAVDLLVQALIADPEAVGEAELRRVVAVMPRPAARRVELATAGPVPSLRRQRLGRLLRESVDDPVALAAAEGLARLGGSTGWSAGTRGVLSSNMGSTSRLSRSFRVSKGAVAGGFRVGSWRSPQGEPASALVAGKTLVPATRRRW